MDTPGKIFHANFLGYAHWFMHSNISQLKDHSISVDQDRYNTYFVAKYLDTATVKENSKFHKTILHNDMIFTKEYASTIDKQVKLLYREFNIY